MATAVKDVILIPRKAVFEGKTFEGSTKESALRLLLGEGFEPVYMPEIIDGRNEYSPEESPQNWQWLYAPSIRATGKTKAGTPLVVYSHVTNYFLNPENIAEAGRQGFIKGAGIMPDEEFWRLVDLAEEQEGKPNQLAFIVDYTKLQKSTSGLVKVKDALKHPQTVPFLGGKRRAETYLPRHEKFLGDKIGIWHINDIVEGKSVGRVQCLSKGYLGLYSNINLNSSACFVGVREGAEGAARQKQLETILMTLGDTVAPSAVPEARKRLRNVGYR